ncbi:MAG: ABC transporter permease, partial [Clostridia bacterium]|nr:ABC transporter permease [Clostridia bacterium]
MKKFWKNANFRLKLGLIMTLFFLILGFVVYFIPHTNPFPNNIRMKNLPPSSEHFFGTTSQGQDIFWLLIEAIHNSLTIGFIVAFIGTVLGVFVGLIAGFVGGWLDRLLMVITDTFVVIPSLPVLIMMTSLMKGGTTVILLALVLAVFAWAWPSRQIRSMALTMKERDFIHTAWFSGEGT